MEVSGTLPGYPEGGHHFAHSDGNARVRFGHSVVIVAWAEHDPSLQREDLYGAPVTAQGVVLDGEAIRLVQAR
jgi:hypothetical protein